MVELAALEFLVDELALEHDVTRRAECARQVYLHALRGADLGPYLPRLLAISSPHHMTMRHTGWALAVFAYHTDDAPLVSTLLAGPHRVALLQVDHRAKVGAGPITALVQHTASVSGADRQLGFTALSRLAAYGADLSPLIPVLLASLGAKPSGRGIRRLDLDAAARGLLGALLGKPGDHRGALLADLTRCAAGKGAPAKAAQAVLASAAARAG